MFMYTIYIHIYVCVYAYVILYIHIYIYIYIYNQNPYLHLSIYRRHGRCKIRTSFSEGENKSSHEKNIYVMMNIIS